MTTSLKQIEEQVLALSVEDRAKLAAAVLESLRRPSSEARKRWRERMRQRLAAIERGEDTSAFLEGDEFADIRQLSGLRPPPARAR